MPRQTWVLLARLGASEFTGLHNSTRMKEGVPVWYWSARIDSQFGMTAGDLSHRWRHAHMTYSWRRESGK